MSRYSIAATLAALGMILLAALSVALVTFVLWRRRRKANMPACASCGYCVRGVSTFNCPECGADLRDVGIVGPHVRLGLGPLFWIAIWTLFLPVPAIWLTHAALQILPSVLVTEHQRSIYMPTLDVRHGLPATIDVTATGEQWSWPWAGSAARLNEVRLLVAYPVQSWLRFAVDGSWYRYDTPDGKVVEDSTAFTPEVLLQWFAALGVDIATSHADELAPFVDDAIQGALRGDREARRHTLDRTDDDPPRVAEAQATIVISYRHRLTVVPAGPQAILGFWGLVWLGGALLIARGRRRSRPG